MALLPNQRSGHKEDLGSGMSIDYRHSPLTWRSVKGDGSISGPSPFYFFYLSVTLFPRAVVKPPFDCARPTRAFRGRALREESKPPGGKVTIRRDLIERGGSSEAWYEGRPAATLVPFGDWPNGPIVESTIRP
jgi:hypothetical protein